MEKRIGYSLWVEVGGQGLRLECQLPAEEGWIRSSTVVVAFIVDNLLACAVNRSVLLIVSLGCVD